MAEHPEDSQPNIDMGDYEYDPVGRIHFSHRDTENVMKSPKQSPFPISEGEWRKIVGKVQGEALRAREVYERRYEGVEIPDEWADIWLAGVYEGKVDAYECLLEFFTWWEHERLEEDGQ